MVICVAEVYHKAYILFEFDTETETKLKEFLRGYCVQMCWFKLYCISSAVCLTVVSLKGFEKSQLVDVNGRHI